MPVELPKGQRLFARAGSRYFEHESTHQKHHHSFFELLYVTEGRTRIHIRGRDVEAGPGDLVIFYPGEDHLERVQPGTFSIITLRFSPEAIALPEGFPSRRETEPVVRLPWPDRFQTLFGQMVLEHEMDDQWHDTMSGVYLVQFVVLLRRALANLARSAESPNAERSMLIENTIAMIHSSLDTNLPLRELAERAYMSESYFSHMFKDVTGVSPKRYQMRARMMKALEMLQETPSSVKEVAAALGYDDPHYFSRVFKKVTGQSPTSIRARKQKSTPS